MAPRFLCKTALAPGQSLQTESGVAFDAYPTLKETLAAAHGPAFAELFAEPIVTWSTTPDQDSTISWYSELSGNAVPLDTLPSDRRAMVEQRLRDAVRQLSPLLSGASAPMLQRALCVRNRSSIWAVGEQPVLTEWGMRPDGASATADPSMLLGQSVLATYLPSAEPIAPVPAAPQPIVAQPAAPVRSASVAPARRALPWFVVPAALVIAALFLGLGYWRGSILAAERAASRDPVVKVLDQDAAKQALEQQNALNAGLEREIELRRRTLSQNVCVADPSTMPRLGPDRAAVPAPAVVPPPPGGALFQGTLADLLKQGIVMVVAGGDGDDVSLGTGFFVTPELIATNRHVIEHAANGKIVVLNLKLGHPLAATVVASTPTSDIGALDLALLKVAPQAVQPLAFSTAAAELDPVIAAGYPPLITGADGAMQRLLSDGDISAAPQLIMTDGRIQAIQTSPEGVKIMPHGAAVSAGNSGGPLVDACGRVVGIVTFIRADAASAAHANFALKTDSLLPFLRDHGAAVTQSDGPCAPGAPAAPATAPTQPAPAATPPAH